MTSKPKPPPAPPPQPVTYDHCQVCGAPKRATTSPYCTAHADLAR